MCQKKARTRDLSDSVCLLTPLRSTEPVAREPLTFYSIQTAGTAGARSGETRWLI